MAGKKCLGQFSCSDIFTNWMQLCLHKSEITDVGLLIQLCIHVVSSSHARFIGTLKWLWLLGPFCLVSCSECTYLNIHALYNTYILVHRPFTQYWIYCTMKQNQLMPVLNIDLCIYTCIVFYWVLIISAVCRVRSKMFL